MRYGTLAGSNTQNSSECYSLQCRPLICCCKDRYSSCGYSKCHDTLVQTQVCCRFGRQYRRLHAAFEPSQLQLKSPATRSYLKVLLRQCVLSKDRDVIGDVVENGRLRQELFNRVLHNLDFGQTAQSAVGDREALPAGNSISQCQNDPAKFHPIRQLERDVVWRRILPRTWECQQA